MEPDSGYSETAPARTTRFHLWSVLAIVLSAGFVTLVALFTGDLATSWPLFIIPIIVSALAYEVPGAIATVASIVLMVALLLPDIAVGSLPRAELAVGLATFLACGVVVGVQSGRSRSHSLALERSSIRDAETGLYKASYLRSRLSEEVVRGSRHDFGVGLLIIHVDDLRRFGETFGSYKAGLLLEHMADILRITVRETDIVGRWGVDAFAAVLPFADPTEAALIARRVQEAVRRAEFEGDVLQPVAQAAVSVASACYPSEAPEYDTLVALAEDRLEAILGSKLPGETNVSEAAQIRTGEVLS